LNFNAFYRLNVLNYFKKVLLYINAFYRWNFNEAYYINETLLVDEFHIELNILVTKDPTLDPKAVYDATRMRYTEEERRRGLSSHRRWTTTARVPQPPEGWEQRRRKSSEKCRKLKVSYILNILDLFTEDLNPSKRTMTDSSAGSTLLDSQHHHRQGVHLPPLPISTDQKIQKKKMQLSSSSSHFMLWRRWI